MHFDRFKFEGFFCPLSIFSATNINHTHVCSINGCDFLLRTYNLKKLKYQIKCSPMSGTHFFLLSPHHNWIPLLTILILTTMAIKLSLFEADSGKWVKNSKSHHLCGSLIIHRSVLIFVSGFFERSMPFGSPSLPY